MATKVLERKELDLTSSRRTLVVIWQNPDSRRFVKVAQVDALDGGHVAFQYLDSAWEDTDFIPLVEFPDPGAAYVSSGVPAFLANRVLSSARPDYARYLSWLGVDALSDEDVPFEVLARTGGGRVTDTFHVVDLPLDQEDSFASRFFVSGISHVIGSDGALADLKDGAALLLRLDEQNPKNPRAVLVYTDDGRKVGYVPDWLCSDVYQRIKEGWEIEASADRVNRDAPAHIRVLCRIEARRGVDPRIKAGDAADG